MTRQERKSPWQACVSKFDSARREWLERVATGAAAGPFQPDWQSLEQYQPPAWYEKARFGIFIHWGALSVPAFGSEFNARAWAKLFREAGARYVVPVAEHHDGLAMYDSQLSDWTAVKMGPRRDVLGQLRAAILAEGLHFGLSSHRPGHDGFFDDWLARTAELVTRYEPELVCFDWWVGQPAFRDTLPKFLAYFYNQAATRGGAVVDYKLHDFAPGHDTSKSPEVVIHALADVVSKNGNLLLNVGPRADGSIPEEAQKLLREVGAWLQVNGEAIYDSKPWRKFGEGPTANAGTFQEAHAKPCTAEDFCFTTHGGHLYAIELGWPDNGQALIRSITPESKVGSVRLLGSARQVPFTQDADGLHLYLPKQRPGAYAWVYRIETH